MPPTSNPGNKPADTPGAVSTNKSVVNVVSPSQIAEGALDPDVKRAPLGSKWEALEAEFSFVPDSVADLKSAVPILIEKLGLVQPASGESPGWYHYLGAEKPIHCSFLRFARLLMYRRIAKVKPGSVFLTNNMMGPAASSRISKKTYAPKLDEAYFLIVTEGKSIVDAATILNIKPSIIERWCQKGNWLGRRIEAERIVVKAAGAETVQDRAIALKTMLMTSVENSRRRLEQMEAALQRKWEVALGDTEELIIRDGNNTEHKKRVTKAGEARLSALLDLNSKLVKQMQELAAIGSARLLDDAGRIKKLRAAKKNRFGRKNIELLGKSTAFKDGPSD